MPITCTTDNRTLTVQLVGEIDHHAARQLMLDLEREIECRFPRQLILDFSAVSFMDSSGIAVLLRSWRRMQEVSGSMGVIHVPRQPGKVLKAANLHRMFPITFENR